MPWRNAHSLHIFAPTTQLYGNNWCEQILGSVVKPLYKQYTDGIGWLWATRYWGPYDAQDPPLNCVLPNEYCSDGSYRYITFRANVMGSLRKEFHERALKLVSETGCFSTDWKNYDIVRDLGSNRFVASVANEVDRAKRAKLVVQFIDATVTLMLDSLIQDTQGKWTTEPNNDHQQNPHGSYLESVHHLFCNATGVPTFVGLRRDGDELFINQISLPIQRLGSHWLSVQIQF